MRHKNLMLTALAALLIGAGSLAIAQDAPPPAPPPAAAPGAKPMPGHDGMQGPQHRHDHAMRPFGADGPSGAVISDLHSLERLYVLSGRAKELPALYNSVLAKSQDPRVRTYVYHHLARAQARPANVDQAMATLRKSLDENLANDAKRRAEMEQMRSQWQQKHAADAAPSAAPIAAH